MRIEHSDLSLPVYERIKAMILNKELQPGEKLLQEKLAAHLGVSRTPLLKALQMLEFDMLVESIPRRGMFVKQLKIQEMMDIYDVREGIESIAVRLAIERASDGQIKNLRKIWEPFLKMAQIDRTTYQKADDEFHALILEYSANKVLSKTYTSSLIQARVVQMGIMRPPEETLPEHLALTEAMLERDFEKADRVIKNHLRKSKASIKENFEKNK